jgi:transcriptional regulator with XRE-family HTH domain
MPVTAAQKIIRADQVHGELRRALGQQVRQLRLDRGLTLEEVATRSGCSLGSLSQLERGLGNPSFATLVRISHALRVSVGRLVELEQEDANGVSPVVRKDQRRRFNPHNSLLGDGTVYELLTPDLERALEVIYLHVPPGTSTEATPFVHDGEETGLILKGTHEVHVDGVLHVLEPGDSISYPSTRPHWYRNPGSKTVEAVWIITPPTF